MASTPSLDDLRIDRSDDRDRSRRWPWVVAVCLLALGGGVAYAAFHEYQTATMNWQTFSQVAFVFTVTPALLIQGAAYALVMGLFGGLFPAIRAARLPIVTALREL